MKLQTHKMMRPIGRIQKFLNFDCWVFLDKTIKKENFKDLGNPALTRTNQDHNPTKLLDWRNINNFLYQLNLQVQIDD